MIMVPQPTSNRIFFYTTNHDFKEKQLKNYENNIHTDHIL